MAVTNNMFNRLDDLLARDVVPQWFEGVAVIQLVCRQLRTQEPETFGFPAPADILIAPGGSVTIAGRSEGNPVEAAAHVLGLMLGDDVPVRLRLAVSQATATKSAYASLTEFSEALAYFERPNPELIVEAFRQRAIAAAPRDITPAVRIDAPQVIHKHSAPVPAAPARRISRLAVIAATFSALACASVWLIGHPLTNVLSPKIVMAEAAESAAPSSHPGAKATAVRVPQRESVSVTAPTARPAEPTGSARKFVVAPTQELQVSVTKSSYEYPELSLLKPISVFPVTTEVGLAVSEPGFAAHPEEASDRIYSRADPEVTLPLNVYPRFPNEAPNAPAAGRTIVELTIAADGLVERVRMLTVPRNIHEWMLLSAAKAWRFEPARIDGRAVRFRHTMALVTMP